MTQAELVVPVLGSLAKAAMRLPIDGQKRRKLLILIAAYNDGGTSLPPEAELLSRLSFLAGDPRKLRGLVQALERDGWLQVSRRGRFIPLFDKEGAKRDLV